MAVIEVIRSIPWVQPLHHRAPASTTNTHDSRIAGHHEIDADMYSGFQVTRFPDDPILIYPFTKLPIYQISLGVSR